MDSLAVADDTVNGCSFNPAVNLLAVATGHRRYPLQPTDSDSDSVSVAELELQDADGRKTPEKQQQQQEEEQRQQQQGGRSDVLVSGSGRQQGKKRRIMCDTASDSRGVSDDGSGLGWVQDKWVVRGKGNMLQVFRLEYEWAEVEDVAAEAHEDQQQVGVEGTAGQQQQQLGQQPDYQQRKEEEQLRHQEHQEQEEEPQVQAVQEVQVPEMFMQQQPQ